MAYLVGPSGVAYVGQFQSFLSITNNTSNLGIGNGTIKYLSEYKDDPSKYSNILSISLLITICSSSILALLIFIFKTEISLYLFNTTQYDFILLILSLTIVLYSSAQILSHALNAFQEIKKLLLARIAASIIGLISTLFFVFFWGVQGALIALIISQCIGFFILIIAARTSSWFSKANFLKIKNNGSAQKLLKFSLMAFCSIILLNIRQIYLRNYIILELSPEAAGHWQAIWKISELYLTIITSSLAIYYLPKLSSIQDKRELKKEIYKGYRFLLPIVLVLSTLIFISRDLIIVILFTEEFSTIRDLFLYQLIGDVFKIASWILSFLMLAKAMTKTYIITEIIFISLFLILALFFVQNSGLIGMTQAFMLTYILYFLTMLWIFRNLLFYQKNKAL
ncbi:MAG: O-antigen translocase [Aureispira sp.]|nr:O-antigen translocase [Aureispira sp.]